MNFTKKPKTVRDLGDEIANFYNGGYSFKEVAKYIDGQGIRTMRGGRYNTQKTYALYWNHKKRTTNNTQRLNYFVSDNNPNTTPVVTTSFGTSFSGKLIEGIVSNPRLTDLQVRNAVHAIVSTSVN